jgi:O-6-methylguanine DNA methyltransferase
MAIEGPAGPIHVAVTERGVVAVSLASRAEDFEAGLARRLRRPVRWLDPGEPSPPHLRDAVAAIEALLTDGSASAAGTAPSNLTGTAERTEIPLDLADRPAWDRAVLDAVRAIPRGEVRSYGDIARAVDRPGAARAVGGAVGRNPVALLVPCHRVVAGDGTLGGYGGGWWGDRERLLDLKAELLAREGVSLPRSLPGRRRGR